LRLDLVRAEFRGNGEESVVGRIWAAPGGPQEITIAPGTQFWAQLAGPGGGGFGQIGGGRGGGGLRGGGIGQIGGGRQGMGALGQNTVPFGGDRYAEVRLPTACTDLGLPAPTRRDIMVPAPCPDVRVAAVAALYGQPGVHPAAVQVAIWALTDDPSRAALSPYLTRVVKSEGKVGLPIGPEAVLAAAAEVLGKAGIGTQAFAAFR
jgi:hypothetical protein